MARCGSLCSRVRVFESAAGSPLASPPSAHAVLSFEPSMTSSMLVRETLWHVPFLAALVVAVLVSSTRAGQAAEPPSRTAILQELRSFAPSGSVLYLAAHPDDENTQVITYMARGRGYRTAYLSLTRGDGGQNLLGPQLGEALGVARTQGLVAGARR